jgi:PIN domain nuclease of toxin-antitoxin system
MVLDTSAVLAFLLGEPGRDRVVEVILAGAEMTTANFAEVATRYVLRGAKAEARGLRERLPVSLVPVDDDLALRAALMAAVTQAAGLSLGDRLCLAQAQRSGHHALTADRNWAKVAEEVGVVVEAIR